MTTKKKQRYRIRNWREYNKALVGRGSLTLWIDTHATETWLDRDIPARPGRRRIYTDAAILCALLLREVYHLPLRPTQGLVSSVPASHANRTARASLLDSLPTRLVLCNYR